MTNHAAQNVGKRGLNRRHEELLMWAMLNPQKTQRELARDLGYSESWVSTLMATDMFQERLKSLRDTYHSTSFVGVQSKVEAAATLALNRMIEVLENDRENQLSPTYILEATSKLLERFEKINGEQSPQQQNGVTVNVGIAQEITAALSSVKSAQQQLAPIDHHDSDQGADGTEQIEAPTVEPV